MYLFSRVREKRKEREEKSIGKKGMLHATLLHPESRPGPRVTPATPPQGGRGSPTPHPTPIAVGGAGCKIDEMMAGEKSEIFGGGGRRVV